VEFYLPVDCSESGCEVFEREMRIHLKKKEPDWWPRLLYDQQKLNWLKIDFDRWKEPADDSEDEGMMSGFDPNMSTEDYLRQEYPEVYEKMEKERQGFISESKRKTYLFCYNLFMFCGFLYVSLIMVLRYAKFGEEFFSDCYASVGDAMKFLHLLMFLEVMHPMFGYTKGSILEAALQVSSPTPECVRYFLMYSNYYMHLLLEILKKNICKY